jgi:hypothetical protein
MSKRNSHSRLKLKDYLWLLIGALALGYATYKLFYRAYCNHLLASDKTKTVNAVIIHDKNYIPNSPVGNHFSYSYYYEVNGVGYKGNSHHPELQPGDSVLIRYVIDHPSVSEPLTQTE